MAVRGKKKQKKGKTLTLTDFLAEDGGGNTPAYIPSKPVSWADETDDLDNEVSTAWPSADEDMYKPAINRALLPTAPRAARAPDVDTTRLPKYPPYTAFLGNLPYDVSEECIREFFHGLNISAVRLPRESMNQDRLKGFGYAEFDDVDSLINALSLNEEMLQNRRIRVDIADQAQDKDKDDRFGRGGERDRTRDLEMETDWRARPAPSNDDYPPRRSDDSFGSRDRFDSDRFRDRDGPRRDGDRFDGRDRFRDDGFKDRGYDRGGSRREFGTGFRRDTYDDKRSDDFRGGGDRYGDRYNSGFDRYERREERRSDFSSRDDMRHEDRGSVQRPKLNLQPRSVSNQEVVRAPPPPSSGRSASIFGAAKPVDTTAKEREVEERLKKEQDKLLRQLDDQERGVKTIRQPRERHPSWRTEDQPERSRTASESSQPSSSTSRVRRESEKSLDNDVFKSEEPPHSPASKSTKSDQPPPLKVVPAPPPKENAWAKRTMAGSSQSSDTEARQSLSPDSKSEDTSQGNYRFYAVCEGRQNQFMIPFVTGDQNEEGPGVKRETTSPTGQGGGSGGVSQGRSEGANKDRRKEPDRKDKRDSKPATEPKKYEESSPPKFSSASKYAALMIDEDGEEGTD
uniref:Eukaryotic translation initiation factor 4B n=1 Tax=Callorhinchus milii TaxID=7868 RepID=A0A4W3HC82_CALMI